MNLPIDIKKYRDEILNYKPKLPLGYGPFRVLKVTSSDMLFEKVKKYPGIENIEIDKIEIYKETANQIIYSQLAAGNADLQSCVAPKDVVESIIESNPNMKHIVIPGFGITAIFFNHEKYPYNQLNFRKALSYIIDFERVKVVTSYYSDAINYSSGVVPSIADQWIDISKFTKYSKDKQKAEDLLSSLGFKKNNEGLWCDDKGKELNLVLGVRNDYSDWVLMADEISRQLTEFGLNTKPQLIPNTIFASKVQAGEYEMCIEASIAALRHPYEGYRRLYGKRSIL